MIFLILVSNGVKIVKIIKRSESDFSSVVLCKMHTLYIVSYQKKIFFFNEIELRYSFPLTIISISYDAIKKNERTLTSYIKLFIIRS